MLKLGVNSRTGPIDNMMRSTLIIFTILLLAGCQEASGVAAPTDGQDLFLGVIAFLLFLATLVFAAKKAFGKADDRSSKIDKAEFRARVAAFAIGILVTIIIIAVDTGSSGTLSIIPLFALVPWYFLIILGTGLGFIVAFASYVVSHYRVTDGYEFVILTVTTCGSLGMYLAFYGTGLRHNILAGLLSVLVGLLVFRMLFPLRPEAKPVQKESTQS